MPINKDLWDLFVQSEENKERAKQQALDICSEFLGPLWADKSFTIEKLSGGQTNLVFKCSIPEQDVLLRIQCDKDVMQLQNELIILMKLAENGLGPRLLGVFDGGRLEEFIPSSTLTNDHCRKPGFSRQIAKALAKIHQAAVPLRKSPQLIPTLREWVNRIQKNGGDEFDLWSHFPPITKDKFPSKIDISSMKKEIHEIEAYLKNTRSPSRLIHNDLYGPNILLRDGYTVDEDGIVKKPEGAEDDPLVIIDFEFAMYNYRGLDIGNHLNDLAIIVDGANFGYDFKMIETLQKAFINAYLEETYLQLKKMNKSLEEEGLTGDLDKDFEILAEEAATFESIANFRWGLWEIICHQEGIVGTDFYNSLRHRLTLYYYLKKF